MSINLYPHRITIAAKTTTNNKGGQETTYTASATNVPALVSPASGQTKMLYSQRNVLITHEVFTPRAVTVNTGDIVQFGSRSFMVRDFRNVLESGRLYVIDCWEVMSTDIIYQDN